MDWSKLTCRILQTFVLLVYVVTQYAMWVSMFKPDPRLPWWVWVVLTVSLTVVTIDALQGISYKEEN